MRVRQFKIRINQGSFIKYSTKDWVHNWITTNKPLWRQCLHAEIHILKTVNRQGDRGAVQFGNINLSFLNNFTQIQYFSFSYLRKMLPVKQQNLYESWTLSTHYNKMYRKNKFKYLVINKNNKLALVFVN